MRAQPRAHADRVSAAGTELHRALPDPRHRGRTSRPPAAEHPRHPGLGPTLCLRPPAPLQPRLLLAPWPGALARGGVLCLYLVTLGGLCLIHRHLASGMENFTCGVAMETSRATKEVYGERNAGSQEGAPKAFPTQPQWPSRHPKGPREPCTPGAGCSIPSPGLRGAASGDGRRQHLPGDQPKPSVLVRHQRWGLLSNPRLTSGEARR